MARSLTRRVAHVRRELATISLCQPVGDEQYTIPVTQRLHNRPLQLLCSKSKANSQ